MRFLKILVTLVLYLCSDFVYIFFSIFIGKVDFCMLLYCFGLIRSMGIKDAVARRLAGKRSRGEALDLWRFGNFENLYGEFGLHLDPDFAYIFVLILPTSFLLIVSASWFFEKAFFCDYFYTVSYLLICPTSCLLICPTSWP